MVSHSQITSVSTTPPLLALILSTCLVGCQSLQPTNPLPVLAPTHIETTPQHISKMPPSSPKTKEPKVFLLEDWF